jgi:hypothetical protein
MLLPPYGFCLPIVFRRVEDARTVLVEVTGGDGLRDRFLVELAGCEPVFGRQAAAIDAIRDALEAAHQLSLWLPLPACAARFLRTIEHRPLAGEIFIDTGHTLSQHLRRLGLFQKAQSQP